MRCHTSRLLLLWLVLFLAAPVASTALPKKPKPTPTPGPDPNPQIAYVEEYRVNPSRPATFAVMVMNSDGSNQQLVVDCGTTPCFNPQWSPDGTQLVFTSHGLLPGDEGALYTVNVDGTDLAKLVDLEMDGNGWAHAAWSPVEIGGQYWMIYTDENLDPDPTHCYWDLWVYGMDDGSRYLLTNDPELCVIEPAWSKSTAFS